MQTRSNEVRGSREFHDNRRKAWPSFEINRGNED